MSVSPIERLEGEEEIMVITNENRFQITHASEQFQALGACFVVYDLLGSYEPGYAGDWEAATAMRDDLRYRESMREISKDTPLWLGMY